MKALTWQGPRHVEVTEVADPMIKEPADAIIKITSTAICGSDLHLYGVLGPYLTKGDVLGHEPLGVIDLADGRGPDAVIDAVGMEAHGHSSPIRTKLAETAQLATTLLPDMVAAPLMEKAGIDRLDALRTAIRAVRRGGTISLSGVYGGAADPISMRELFDKGIQLRMGQAHVHRWIDQVMPLVSDPLDPLGVQSFATHHMPLDAAPEAYEMFRDKREGCLKVVLNP